MIWRSCQGEQSRRRACRHPTFHGSAPVLSPAPPRLATVGERHFALRRPRASTLLLMRYVWTEGIQPFYAGNWPAPFGITFVADLMSIAFVAVTSVTALAVLFFSIYSLEGRGEEDYYYAAFQFLLVGVNGSFLTGDIFNLFVFFEVMLLASYLLISLGGRRLQLQETLKYALINNVASGFFLLGVAGLYRTYGTLNMADLALRTAPPDSDGWLSASASFSSSCSASRRRWSRSHFWLPQPTSPARRPSSPSLEASSPRRVSTPS